MAIITGIKSQKKKDRMNIYLDGKFGFGIDLENFVKAKLKVGQELSEKEINEVATKGELQKSLDKILRFGMVRPRSEREFRDWMKRKEVPESMHGKLLEKLKYFDLLDDVKFTQWWVEQRNSFRPRPKKVLKLELLKKGIGREIIEEVLGEEKIDENKMAEETLRKKSYKWKGLEGRERRGKMSAFLAARGFDWEVVKMVVAKFKESE